MNAHEKLREKLDLFPQGFPKQPETEEMLQILFSPEEAALAAELHAPPLMQGVKLVARRAGMDRALAAGLLSGMADRGLVMEKEVLGEMRYMLLPAYPGFIEAQFFKGVEQTENRKRVGELWHEMYKGEFGHETNGYPTSAVRVIPIQKSLDTTQRIYNFEEAQKNIKASGTIALTDCACRKSAGRCDKPLEVCMLMGPLAEYSADRGFARIVTMREAVKVLEASADAGLVHTTGNSKPPLSILCNCCTCCCGSLKGITVVGRPVETVRSNFVSRPAENAQCKRCGKCEKVCPMEAISVGEERAEVNEKRCLGCGVCVNKCKHGALQMVRTGREKPFPSTFHLMAKMFEERGKLPRLLDNVRKDILRPE